MSESLTESQGRRVLEAAVLAPSQDNCQPWRFAWRDRRLRASHDSRRAAGPVNAGCHLSLLSLGCLLESIRLAAAAEGLDAQWELALDDLGTEEAWAVIRFERGGQAADAEMAEGLRGRCTDRRLYHGGDLGHPAFGEILNDAASYAGGGLYLSNGREPGLRRYLARAEGYVWSHRSTQQALLSWIRFGSDPSIARDGMPWRSLGASYLESRVLLLCRWYGLQRALNPVLLPLARGLLLHQIGSSAGLGCITVREPGPVGLVEAGRLALRSWVRLNRRGFGYHPLALPAIGAYNARVGALPGDTRPEFRRLFERGGEEARAAFGFPPGETPVWLFRTGLADPMPASARARRLDPSSLLQRSCGRTRI